MFLSKGRYALLGLGCRRSSSSVISFHCRPFLTSSSCHHGLSSSEENLVKPFVPFAEIIEKRRLEAKRSLVVQVKSQESASDLYEYCNRKFGTVKGLYFHNNVKYSNFKNVYIVEFEEVEAAEAAIKSGQHISEEELNSLGAEAIHPITVVSRMMWFSTNNKAKTKEEDDCLKEGIPPHVEVRGANPEINEMMIHNHLEEFAGQLDEQIQELYEIEKMTDTSTRIRFLACEQVETAISGLFPRARVLPFGSSVNSFGTFHSDLDMVLDLDGRRDRNENKRKEDKDLDCRKLMFHTKGGAGGMRQQANSKSKGHKSENNAQTRNALRRKYCDQFSYIIQGFLPGCQKVVSLSNARVPIVKFNHTILGIECDLAMENVDNVHMAELLYIFGEIEPRLRTLFFTVRHWAKENQLVNENPMGHLFKNFVLLALTINYFQTLRMLPTLDFLAENAGDQDRIITKDGNDCTFVRDIRVFPEREALNKFCKDTTPVSRLLRGFFSFYSEFPFDRRAISLRHGANVFAKKRAVTDPSFASKGFTHAIDVVHPFSPEANMASNVQAACVDQFKKQCKASAVALSAMERGKISANLKMLFTSLDMANLFDDDDEKSSKEPALPLTNNYQKRTRRKKAKKEKALLRDRAKEENVKATLTKDFF